MHWPEKLLDIWEEAGQAVCPKNKTNNIGRMGGGEEERHAEAFLGAAYRSVCFFGEGEWGRGIRMKERERERERRGR